MKEYTYNEAVQWLKDNGMTCKAFYRNVLGWRVYYTHEPTWATPTGADKNFPRTLIITDKP